MLQQIATKLLPKRSLIFVRPRRSVAATSQGFLQVNRLAARANCFPGASGVPLSHSSVSYLEWSIPRRFRTPNQTKEASHAFHIYHEL